MKKLFIFLTAIILTITTLSGCAHKAPISNEKPVIAVSIIPEQAFAEAVCGDLAEVITLIPPGSSPANYEPTPQEQEKFNKADIYFSIGVPTEETNILPNLNTNTKLVELAKEVSAVYPDLMLGKIRDPHIWLSPKRAMLMVKIIAREMSLLDPANQAIYQKNADVYTAQLKALDLEITESLAATENKKFIVFHPAFGYLAEDYGIIMYALEENGKEATAAHLREMIDFAKAEGIKIIFYQAEIDSSQSAAFAEEIGGKAVQLAPLAYNYLENLKVMANAIREAIK
ncbi:MAG: zinc ABC transporter substrate-binding protein [Clostridia bacterium]|nr:zinc ABC transporter substrate-binding protein [Clostridia bacterium]